MAQERSQGILRSLEEVSAYSRCVPSLLPLSTASASTVLSYLTPVCHLCLAGIEGNGKSPSKSELHRLYLTEKYLWRWKQFLSRRGKRTTPLDLKLGHNNWLRQVSTSHRSLVNALHLPSSAVFLLPVFCCSHPSNRRSCMQPPTGTGQNRAVLSCLSSLTSRPVLSEEQTNTFIHSPCFPVTLRSTVLSLLLAKF